MYYSSKRIKKKQQMESLLKWNTTKEPKAAKSGEQKAPWEVGEPAPLILFGIGGGVAGGPEWESFWADT